MTTIQLKQATKRKLEKVKMFPRETYNQVIERLLERDDEEDEQLSPATIKNIERSLKDIKAGRVYTTEQVKKELGIK
jgi:predicted transcriptional regulator